MVRIEPRLARIQLQWASLTSVLVIVLTWFVYPIVFRDLTIGAGCVLLTYTLVWPFHLITSQNSRRVVVREAVLIPIRLGILVALSLYAIDNVARPGAPFALGIAIPVVAGSIACLWASAKDPRYYWVNLAKPPCPARAKTHER